MAGVFALGMNSCEVVDGIGEIGGNLIDTLTEGSRTVEATITSTGAVRYNKGTKTGKGSTETYWGQGYYQTIRVKGKDGKTYSGSVKVNPSDPFYRGEKGKATVGAKTGTLTDFDSY